MKTLLSKSEKKHLKKTLEYKNKSVVLRFCTEYGFTQKNANLFFKDLLYFLWLTDWVKKQNRKNKTKKMFVGIRRSLMIIDEMWHTFVLYSRDYEDFCTHYFKEKIYHNPGPSYLEIVQNRTPPATGVEAVWKNQKELTKSLFGTAVHDRWYVEYRKYSFLKIKERQLRAAKSIYK